MKYKVKINIYRTLSFILLWILLNHRYISIDKKLDDTGLLKFYQTLMPGTYSDAIEFIGVIFTIIYIVSLFAILKHSNVTNVFRYGKDRFVINSIKDIIIDSIIFSTQYCTVNIIFCMLFVKFDLLIKYKFFLFYLSFIVAISVYFIFVGLFTLFLKTVCSFKSYFLYIDVLTFILLYGIAEINIHIQPALFLAYTDEWFYAGNFDFSSYFVKLIIMIIACVILSIANRLIFIKKDIIINEE